MRVSDSNDVEVRTNALLRAHDQHQLIRLSQVLASSIAEAQRTSGVVGKLASLVKPRVRLGGFADPVSQLIQRIAEGLTREQRAFNRATLEALQAIQQMLAISLHAEIAERIDAATEGLQERFEEETDRLRTLERGLLALRDELEGREGQPLAKLPVRRQPGKRRSPK